MAAEVVLIVLGLVAFEEAAGVAAVGEAFEFAQQAVIKRTACNGIVNRFAVGLGDAGNVVERLGAAFDFEAVHADLATFSRPLRCRAGLWNHDVCAVFVFHNRHHFARTVGLFNQEDLVGVGVAFLTVDASKFWLASSWAFSKLKPCRSWASPASLSVAL